MAKRHGRSRPDGKATSARGPAGKDNPGITAFRRKGSKKPQAGAKDRKSGIAGSRSWRGRIFRVFAIVTLLLLLAPIVLGLIYRIPAVKPVSTLMLFGWATNQKVDRRWVPFEKISPQLVQAVIMSEDGQYCLHNGVDWQALNTVIDDAMDGEKTRGASTITMQNVKNLFLWNSRSYLRKALEVPLALYVDAIWSKRRQLEIYLNIAEWGPGVYGVEAAARYHFNRPAARLNRAQSALLAVTLPNPKLRNPKKPSRRMKVLARINQARARVSGPYVRCLN